MGQKLRSSGFSGVPGLCTEAWHSLFPAPPPVSQTPQPWLLHICPVVFSCPHGDESQPGGAADSSHPEGRTCGPRRPGALWLQRGGAQRRPEKPFVETQTCCLISSVSPWSLVSEQSFLLGERSASYSTEALTPHRMGLPPPCLHLQLAQRGRSSEDHIWAEDPGRDGAPHFSSDPYKGRVWATLCCAEASHSNPFPQRHAHLAGRSDMDTSRPCTGQRRTLTAHAGQGPARIPAKEMGWRASWRR